MSNATWSFEITENEARIIASVLDSYLSRYWSKDELNEVESLYVLKVMEIKDNMHHQLKKIRGDK